MARATPLQKNHGTIQKCAVEADRGFNNHLAGDSGFGRPVRSQTSEALPPPGPLARTAPPHEPAHPKPYRPPSPRPPRSSELGNAPPDSAGPTSGKQPVHIGQNENKLIRTGYEHIRAFPPVN